MAVVIGVTPCRALADYLESLRRVGAEPRVLDFTTDRPGRVAGEVDGVLLTGGADINPMRYGAPRHPATDGVISERDDFELELARRTLEQDRPVLGLCRGLQILNVALGGTLFQDIPTEVPGAIDHRMDEPRYAIAHEVWIAPDSRLGRIMGDAMSDRDSDRRSEGGKEGDELAYGVNSRHHQAVRRLADGFVVCATAPDGVVEAIEQPLARFCLGVQWHPENFWRTGEFRGLFEAFVQACSADRAIR